MEVTLVNGANAIARSFARRMSALGATKITLVDQRPFRDAVYDLQDEIKDKTVLEKHQAMNYASLEIALEESENVVYFTHDYLSYAHDKNSLLVSTANACKEVGAKKLMAVCPIEMDMYWTEDGSDPMVPRNESVAKARKAFPDMVDFRTNLIFGNYSYFMRYLEQSCIAGKISPELNSRSDPTKYHPLHYDDMFNAIKEVGQNYDDHKGKSYSLNGAMDMTLSEVMHSIKERSGHGQVQDFSTRGLGNWISNFFNGLPHDKNMRLMAEYYKGHTVDFLDNDFYTKHGMEHKHEFVTSFRPERYTAERFEKPAFIGYKSVCLD